MEKHVTLMAQLTEISSAPFSAQMFGNAGIEHMKRYGTKPEHFAKIAYKNHKHSVNNPYSQFREEYSLDQIKNSPVISGILTKLQCCPTSDGSAAAVVVSERFVRSHGLEAQAVEIVGMEMATDLASTFADNSCIKLVSRTLSVVPIRKQSLLHVGRVRHDQNSSGSLVPQDWHHPIRRPSRRTPRLFLR